MQANEPLERFELPREEAIALMESQGQSYKVELIRDLPEDAVISFYKQGDFVDLCAGQMCIRDRPSESSRWKSIFGP